MMKLIDDQYMKTAVYGTRSMRNYLNRLGYSVNRKRVQRFMRLMGLEAIYPKPKTSKPHPGHRIYPYWLRGMTSNRPDMAWATDITYIPFKQGFMYLVAVNLSEAPGPPQTPTPRTILGTVIISRDSNPGYVDKDSHQTVS